MANSLGTSTFYRLLHSIQFHNFVVKLIGRLKKYQSRGIEVLDAPAVSEDKKLRTFDLIGSDTVVAVPVDQWDDWILISLAIACICGLVVILDGGIEFSSFHQVITFICKVAIFFVVAFVVTFLSLLWPRTSPLGIRTT